MNSEEQYTDEQAIRDVLALKRRVGLKRAAELVGMSESWILQVEGKKIQSLRQTTRNGILRAVAAQEGLRLREVRDGRTNTYTEERMIDEYDRYAALNGLPSWADLTEEQQTVIRHEWDAMVARLASAELRWRKEAFSAAQEFIKGTTESKDFL